MARGPQRLEAFAQALATGVTPVQAARIAGYPNGSCLAPNARKRARRNDVKAMIAELRKPAIEKLQKEIVANIEFATETLMSIANAELDLSKTKASDKIRAIEVLAKLHGWNAPEKTNVGEELKIERCTARFWRGRPGVKRTRLFAPHMSPFDQKRTWSTAVSDGLGRARPSNSQRVNGAFGHLRRITFASCTHIDDGFCDQLCDRIVAIAELENDERSFIGIGT